MKHALQLLVVVALPLVVRGAEPAAEAPLGPKYLREHAQTRGFMLGRPVKAKPTPDGKAVLFLRSAPRTPKLSLFEFEVANGKTRELLTPEQLLKGAEEKLSPEEKARRERQRVSVGGFTDYQLDDAGRQILLGLSGRLYVMDRAAGGVKELKTGTGTILDPKFSPDGKQVSYVKDHDVFVYDLAKDRESRITTGGTEKKTHGLAEFVAQEEMDRHAGYWWSPDSKFIVYEEADADGVEVWYVADPAKPEQPPQPSYYPRPGKKNVQVRLGVVPAAGGETAWIDWDHKKFEYLTQVRWEKHGPLTLTVQNRLQNEIVLLKADPRTGKTTVLLTETDPTWVNINQDGPRWLADGTFLRTGEGKKGPQFELRAADGKLLQVFTTGEDGYQGLLAVEPSSRSLAVQFSQDPTQSRFGSGILNKLTFPPPLLPNAAGIYSAAFSKDQTCYVVSGGSPKSMPQSTVYQDRGAPVGELPSVAEAPGFTPRVEFPLAGNAPGYRAAIVRPHGFDPKKKYPVVLYVYGGPGHQVVLQSMRSWLLPQWIADQGFVVAALDNRGTPNRGRDWERALYKQFGAVPLEDQVAGLQALGKRYPELDLERVGVYGWSFGGYLSALAVLKRPDIFKAAVAGAPVTDWEDYDTHYTERYLGLPQDNPEAYRDASLLTYAKDLKRPLLLIHGTADDNVYFRHSLKLADALFRAGKDFDMLPLSGLTHMVPDPVVMERLYGRIAGHFQKHLGPPK